MEARRVERTTRRTVGRVVTITLTDLVTHQSQTLTDLVTHQSQTLTATEDHPFYVQGKGFVPAGQLGVGRSIVTRAGPALTVSGSVFLPQQVGGYTVYNLTVEGDHTYFVGSVDGGAWVHNEDCTKVAEGIIAKNGSGEVWGACTRSGEKFPFGGDVAGNPWYYHDVVRDGDNIVDTYTNRDLADPETPMHIDKWKEKFDPGFDFDTYWSFEKGSANGRSGNPRGY